MLHHFHITGFRSLRDATLAPGRVTVLIGPNGSGKSNLLSALGLVSSLHARTLQRYIGQQGGASQLLHYGPKETQQLTCTLRFDQDTSRFEYEAVLGYAAGDTLVFLDERIDEHRDTLSSTGGHTLGGGHKESLLEDAASAPGARAEQLVHRALSQMRFFHFHDTSFTSALRTNARAEDTRGLHSDGGNLAACLLALRRSHEPGARAAWRRINQIVQQVAPFIAELSPAPVGVLGSDWRDDPNIDLSGRTIRLDWIDRRGAVFSPHHLSDGTLRFIALVTALAQPTETLPRFISIDEPELGLHPAALAVLAGLVRSISHRTQVVLATQSAQLLDQFELDEVVITELTDGATRFERPDAAKLDAWLADYSLSELYDKNLLGGRP